MIFLGDGGGAQWALIGPKFQKLIMASIGPILTCDASSKGFSRNPFLNSKLNFSDCTVPNCTVLY